MEWLRGHTLLNRHISNSYNMEMNDENYDPQACYDSFKEHCHQTLKILSRTNESPSHDDVLGVVNHLEQMSSLIAYDISKLSQSASISSSNCLEFMLNENLFDQLCVWSLQVGKYVNVLKFEQLKLYDSLLGRLRHELLRNQSFLKSFLNFLISCRDYVFSKESEKVLVGLLNHLCTLLMQDVEMIDLFFVTINNSSNQFLIFSLLMPYVHRDDSIGMQARDALLLCMCLSKKNRQVTLYISDVSNFCVLIATGLNGLYSLLPNVLEDITVPDWYRLTPDDVNDVNGLATFVTSLEFCNAVAQVAHPIIRKQLQEFLYRGFLKPVLGPALFQTNYDEQIAAIAYLELILRTVTEPGLLYVTLQFLLKMECDSKQLLTMLVQHINSDSTLCLVTLSLFETLIDLNCEDIMLPLVFEYLQPCLHLMLSQRRLILPLDLHCHSFEKLMSLTPTCCDCFNTMLPNNNNNEIYWNQCDGYRSMYGQYHAYLLDARTKITACQLACSTWSNSYSGCDLDSTTDETSNSLSSLGENSSGYESLKHKIDESQNTTTNSFWQQNLSATHTINLDNINGNCINGQGIAGIFLTNLLGKLKQFLMNSFYVNLHLTGIISRLAAYPQPLLRAYLLNHNLVLQPNVPSLFEIIGTLKQNIDEYLCSKSDKVSLLTFAKTFLLEREIRLTRIRRHVIQKRFSIEQKPETDVQDGSHHHNNNDGKKRIRFSSSITNIFHKKSTNQIPENNNSSIMGAAAAASKLSFEEKYVLHTNFSESQHIALCAVLLDEWLKELAALSQEHTIAQLTAILK